MALRVYWLGIIIDTFKGLRDYPRIKDVVARAVMVRPTLAPYFASAVSNLLFNGRLLRRGERPPRNDIKET